MGTHAQRACAAGVRGGRAQRAHPVSNGCELVEIETGADFARYAVDDLGDDVNHAERQETESEASGDVKRNHD